MAAVTPLDELTAIEADTVLDAPTTAKQIGMSPHTLWRMRQRSDAGGLPWVQLSAGRIGYRLGDIRRYLLSRRVGVAAGEDEAVAAPFTPSVTQARQVRSRPRGQRGRFAPFEKSADGNADEAARS
jgi:hypothetical protein